MAVFLDKRTKTNKQRLAHFHRCQQETAKKKSKLCTWCKPCSNCFVWLIQQKEAVSFWTLNVTILRNESDCYVILSLPTGTARTFRTKTVPNCNNPEWNETFTFRYLKAFWLRTDL
uniref:C2 domain-containing protein n=1 Tax=Dicentrarchus labrax TaxID=13489 RepID=A0A8P4K836_DICLA